MSSVRGGGSVYQPTTVTYEAASGGGDAHATAGGTQRNWRNSPISYLAAAARRPCIPFSACPLTVRAVMPSLLATTAMACFILGVAMLIHGSISYADTSQGIYLTLTIVGFGFLLLSITILFFYLRATGRACWSTLVQHGKQQLSPSGTVQVLTVNPSTDPLVGAAQYTPVSEVVFQMPPDDTEQSKLMPPDSSKDSSNEDTDRIMDNDDPRIVLRPLHQGSSTAVAVDDA